MALETQYTANTAMITLSTKDSTLDGASAIPILTKAGNGTLIKTVRLKGTKTTDFGMVRLYVYDGSTTKIITEVKIPPITRSTRTPTFSAVIPLNYHLGTNGVLKATSVNDDYINVIAEGLDWAYYGSVRPESTKYTANTGMVTISTANIKLDGSDAMGTVLTAGSNGTIIQSVIIKALGDTTPGMVRLFLYDGTTYTKLLEEIPVGYVTKSGIAHSFSHRIDFKGRDFALMSGWSLKASTEIGESFNIIAEGLDWSYPA